VGVRFGPWSCSALAGTGIETMAKNKVNLRDLSDGELEQRSREREA
jgi:hypothetical protein